MTDQLDLYSNNDDFWDNATIRNKIVEVLNAIVFKHPEWAPNEDVLNIILAGDDATNRLGNTNFKATDKNNYSITISVSRYLMRDGLEDLFINTLAHEYGHYLADLELVNSDDVIFNKESKQIEFASPEIEKYFTENKGHGECWQKYVDILSRDLNLKFKITPHPLDPELALYQLRNEDQATVKIYCPTGDIPSMVLYEKTPKAFVINEDFSTLKLIAATLKGDAICNSCGSQLVIAFKNPSDRQVFEELIVEMLFTIFMRTFMD